jgi:ribosome-binding protein aMBF1 (putative translation factor)
MEKTMASKLLRKARERKELSRERLADFFAEFGSQDTIVQKILNLETKSKKTKDERFLRCLCGFFKLSIDDVAREIGFVPEKIKKAYFEGKIQYDEGN